MKRGAGSAPPMVAWCLRVEKTLRRAAAHPRPVRYQRRTLSKMMLHDEYWMGAWRSPWSTALRSTAAVTTVLLVGRDTAVVRRIAREPCMPQSRHRPVRRMALSTGTWKLDQWIGVRRIAAINITTSPVAGAVRLQQGSDYLPITSLRSR